MSDPQPEISIRITLLRPPAGVAFAMQRGRVGLLPPTRQAADALSFDASLRVGGDLADGRPNFLGDFAQGTPADRFVYVTVGTSAGQPGSPWKRRAKVKLAGITREMVDAALASPGAVLEARIEGTGRDGSPACATVPLLDGRWRLVHPRAASAD
jgi:hypothetical protein